MLQGETISIKRSNSQRLLTKNSLNDLRETWSLAEYCNSRRTNYVVSSHWNVSRKFEATVLKGVITKGRNPKIATLVYHLNLAASFEC